MDIIFNLLRAWEAGGALALTGLGLLGLIWCALRWTWVEHEHPLALLRDRFRGLTRWLLLHRRPLKTFPISLALFALGLGMSWAIVQEPFVRWAFQNGRVFIGAHGVLLSLAVVIGINGNVEL